MLLAAGVCCQAENGLVLFIKRGFACDHPGEWCFPGGGLEEGETPLNAAWRECLEETGYAPDGLNLLARSVGPDPAGVTDAAVPSPGDVDFTTFLSKVEAPFEVTLNDESLAYAWAPPSSPPEPLHSGCRGALVLLCGDELDIARAMSLGQLPSPQHYKNVHLWDIRITGTGFSYRHSIDEYVYRKPEVYLNEDFLARCNGLSVILYHPATGALTSDEFAKRIVGSVFLPYIRGDEVWGIAKVYDDDANEALISELASTSPMVVLGEDDNITLETEDGRPLLIEGKPALLDHVALLPKGNLGVWDKGEGPKGVNRSALATPEPAPIMADALARADAMISMLEIRMSMFAHRRARRSAGKSTF